MIDSARADQAQHEGLLADGISRWMRGEDGPEAVAASRIVAETIIMWRVILNSKLSR
jgi:hypothetical protein